MFSCTRAKNLVNKIHGRTLRLIHNDYENRFSDVLETDDEVITFHVKNSQKLMIEILAYQTVSQMKCFQKGI